MKHTHRIINENMLKLVLRFSVPMVLAFLVQSAFNIVDTIFLGRISHHALAAASLMFPIILVFIAVGAGIGVGTNSLVSRYLGAGKKEKAEQVVAIAYSLALVVAILSFVLGQLSAESLFSLMGAEGETLELASIYAHWLFFATPFFIIGMTINAIIRATGEFKIPTIFMASGAIINIFLDYVLIFGKFGFPALGVQGAALATVIARFVPFVLAFWYLLKKVHINLNPFKLVFKLKIIKKVMYVGFPQTLDELLVAVNFFFINRFVAYYGSEALAGFAAVFRLESLALMPAFAISTALVTIIGHNYGAQRLSRIKSGVKIASLMMTVIMVSVGIAFFLLASILVGFFTDTPKAIEVGTSFLKIVPFSYLFFGTTIAISSAFKGVGKGHPSLVLNIVRMFGISIPFAFILSRFTSLQIQGIWIAMMVSNVVPFFIAIIWFRSWLSKKEQEVGV